MTQYESSWFRKGESNACVIHGIERKISILVFRLKVTTEVIIKNPVLWDTTPCPLKITRRFGGRFSGLQIKPRNNPA
jgi:hypothetical protein